MVTPLGMIVKPGYTPGTLKYRIVLDSTASGLNEACTNTFTKLDQIRDLLTALTPGSHISKFDLSDAFLLFPIEASQAEFIGLQDAQGSYYRYRFAPFGVASSPQLCQRFAEELKKIVTSAGLQYVAPLWRQGNLTQQLRTLASVVPRPTWTTSPVFTLRG